MESASWTGAWSEPSKDRAREVRRPPRSRLARWLFFLAVLGLTLGLCAWLLWLLENVE